MEKSEATSIFPGETAGRMEAFGVETLLVAEKMMDILR
jgi:hypothetical protein